MAKVLHPRRRRRALVRNSMLLEEKRDKIGAVALALFLRDGFHGTTTRTIARQAGISTGALFTYFEDKEEILVHIITHQQERAEQQMVKALRQQFEQTANGDADAVAVFSAVFDAFMHAVDELRHFILLAYQETKSLNKTARERLKERERRVQQILVQAIQYGVERGQFAPGAIELKAHSIMILGHAWAVRRWFFAQTVDSIEEYIQFLRPQVLAILEHRSEASRARAGRRLRHRRGRRDSGDSMASGPNQPFKEAPDDSP
jgi:AcrR family transcriptional regulator